jgi:hypothetical protein
MVCNQQGDSKFGEFARHTKILHLDDASFLEIQAADSGVPVVWDEGAIFLGDAQAMDREFGLVGQPAV